MEAPLGKIMRKILSDERTTKKLMQQIILGERFDEPSEDILLDKKKIKIFRVASLQGGPHKNF